MQLRLTTYVVITMKSPHLLSTVHDLAIRTRSAQSSQEDDFITTTETTSHCAAATYVCRRVFRFRKFAPWQIRPTADNTIKFTIVQIRIAKRIFQSPVVSQYLHQRCVQISIVGQAFPLLHERARCDTNTRVTGAPWRCDCCVSVGLLAVLHLRCTRDELDLDFSMLPWHSMTAV